MSAPASQNTTPVDRKRRFARAAIGFAARATIFAAVGLAVLILVGRPMRARGERAMLYVGQQMLRYADAIAQDEPRVVYFNGTTIWLSAGYTDRPLAEVMDFFAGHCSPGGDLTDDLAAFQRGEPVPETGDSGDDGVLPFGGAMRGGNERQAFVACLDGAALSAEGLVGRAKAFVHSGDVGALGSMRYVYGETRGDRTHFIAFWHKGRLSIDELFPTDGDAPGEDSAVAPRPPGSRRLLSMREEGRPYSTTMYADSTLGVAELGRFYQQSLREDGWEIVDRRRKTKDPREAVVLAVRGGLVTIVVVGDDPKGVTTTIMTATPEELSR